MPSPRTFALSPLLWASIAALVACPLQSCRPQPSEPGVRLVYDGFRYQGRPRTFQYEPERLVPTSAEAKVEGSDLLHVAALTERILCHAGLELAAEVGDGYQATLRLTGEVREKGIPRDGIYSSGLRSTYEEVDGTAALELTDGRTFTRRFGRLEDGWSLAKSSEAIAAYLRDEPLLRASGDPVFDEYRDFAPAVAELVARAYSVEPLLAMLAGTPPPERGRGSRCSRVPQPTEQAVQIRAAAATALGNLGDERAVEPLVALLGEMSAIRDTMPSDAWRAGDSRVLASGYVAGRPPSTADHDQSELLRATLRALGRLRDAGAVEAVANLLRKEPHPEYRQLAAIALGRAGDARAVGPLVRALGNSHVEWEIRLELAQTLRELTDQDYPGTYPGAEKWQVWWQENESSYPPL